MQIAIIGIGTFGAKLAETLHSLGGEVIAIDHREEVIEEIKSRVTQAVCMDATDERALRAIGMSDVDTAVVALADDVQSSIMITSLLRQMGVTRIIARAVSKLHEKVLLEVGASQVLKIEEQMGEQTARWIISPHILKHHSFASGYSLVEIKPKEIFIGKKVKDIHLREDLQLGIAAIEKRIPTVDEEGKSIYKMSISCPPRPDDVIAGDDVLVLYGMDSAIETFTEKE